MVFDKVYASAFVCVESDDEVIDQTFTVRSRQEVANVCGSIEMLMVQ
jgi:hypothetical protein